MKTPIVGGGTTGLSGRRTDLSGWQVVVCFGYAQHAISRHTGSSWLDRLANPVLRQVRGGLVTKRDGILDGLEFVRLQRMRCIEPSPIITGGGGKGF